MEVKKELSECDKELLDMLAHWVRWYEHWNNSPTPTEVYDPSIAKSKEMLLKYGVQIEINPELFG